MCPKKFHPTTNGQGKKKVPNQISFNNKDHQLVILKDYFTNYRNSSILPGNQSHGFMENQQFVLFDDFPSWKKKKNSKWNEWLHL